MKIFKYLVLILVFTSITNFLTAGNDLKKIKKVQKQTVTQQLKKGENTKIIIDPKCHACCYVVIHHEDGTSSDGYACAGWLFTSCSTATTKACKKAHDLAEDDFSTEN